MDKSRRYLWVGLIVIIILAAGVVASLIWVYSVNQTTMSTRNSLQTAVASLTVNVQNSISNSNANTKSMSQQLSKTQTSIASLANLNSNFSSQIAGIEKQVLSLSNRQSTSIDNLSNDISELKSSLNTQIDLVNLHISTLQANIAPLQISIPNITNDVASLQSKVTSLSNLQTSIISLTTNLKNISQQLLEEQTSIASLAGKDANLSANLDELNLSIKKIDDQISNIQSRISEVKVPLNEATLEAQLENLNAKLSSLDQDIRSIDQLILPKNQIFTPTISTSDYKISLNNENGIYNYPIEASENSNVLFSIVLLNNKISKPEVFVDGNLIPVVPISNTEYTAFYYMSPNSVGTHQYYVQFQTNNGQSLTSKNEWFYIVRPKSQRVSLGAATPVYNSSYVTGNITLTATVEDPTSKNVEFLIDGKTYKPLTFLNSGATKINRTYIINVNTNNLPEGTNTFVIRDESIDSHTVSATRFYIVDNTLPLLKAFYQNIPSKGATLYTGVNSSSFNIYAYDNYWMKSTSTLGGKSIQLTKNGTTTIHISPISNKNATETFKASLEDFGNHATSISLNIVQVGIPPSINKSPLIDGLKVYNGISNAASNVITVAASVTSPYLTGVRLKMFNSKLSKTFKLTRSATGLWTKTIQVSNDNILPGTYLCEIIATDIASNETASTPSTVYIYKSAKDVFSTALNKDPASGGHDYAQAATITVSINPDWIYAVRKIELYKDMKLERTIPSTLGSNKYDFPIKTSGNYYVVVVDNVDQASTSATYALNIDNSKPEVKFISFTPSSNKAAVSFTIVATELYSGIKNIALEYQTLGSTGWDNGSWSTIQSTSLSYPSTKVISFIWNNINSLPNGKYNLRAKATNGVGVSNSIEKSFINGASTLTIIPTFPSTWTNSTSTTVQIGAEVMNESDVTVFATVINNKLINFGEASYSSNSYNSYPLSKYWSNKFTGLNATAIAEVKVVNLIGSTYTATKLIGFDDVQPSASVIDFPATIGNNKKFTIHVAVSDNLSGIKSVSVNGSPTIMESESSRNQFGVLKGSYVATFTSNRKTSGKATYTVTVTDNASNTQKTIKTLFVDNSAPTITFELLNKNGSRKIIDKSSTITYTSSPASFEWKVTTVSGIAPKVACSVNGKVTHANSDIQAIDKGGVYKIDIVATDTTSKKQTTFLATENIFFGNNVPQVSIVLPTTSVTIPYNNSIHYINYASSNTSYIATCTFKTGNPDIPLKNAELSLYNGSRTTVIYQLSNLTSTSIEKAINLQTQVLPASNGVVYRLTAIATDQALNSNTQSATLYVCVMRPTMSVNKTIYKSGNSYYLDISFSQPMNISLRNLNKDFKFYLPSGMYYTIDASKVTISKSNTFLHIWGLYTEAGNETNVLPLAGNNVTIEISQGITDLASNTIINSKYEVTFSPVS